MSLSQVVFKIENDKNEPTASTLLLMSYALKNPVGYFFPKSQGLVEIYKGNLTAEEQELIFQTRRVINYSDEGESELIKILAQVRALADLAEEKAVDELHNQIQAIEEENE